MGATGGFGGNATMTFRDPVPAGVLRYDMLISLDRVAALDVEGQQINQQTKHSYNVAPLFQNGANRDLRCGLHAAPSCARCKTRLEFRITQLHRILFAGSTFQHGGRGMVISAHGVSIRNNTFFHNGCRFGAASAASGDPCAGSRYSCPMPTLCCPYAALTLC